MTLSAGSPCSPATLPRLAVVFALICVLFLFGDVWLPSTPSPALTGSAALRPTAVAELQKEHSVSQQTSTTEAPEQSHHLWDAECRTAAGAEKVMVILKTGSTELYQKLPIHLATTFRCTPHHLIFSDLSQTFADMPIYDALDTVRSDYKNHHEDFELYRKLQQYQSDGRDPSRLRGDKGWNLDKWKFLPMMHEAFRMSPPEIEWFVFIEADTSLSWTNLLQWLGKLKPKKPLYMGAQNVVGNTEFAHGGSGFIVSRSAVKKVEDYRQKEGPSIYDERWETITASSCCGDEVIARALIEVDVPLTPSWPRIQGETVSTLDWTKKHWCAPAITWHHVSGPQIDSMWQFQTKWVEDHGWSQPYLYRDVFEAFVARHVSVNRTVWNNLSQDTKYTRPSSDDSEAKAVFEKLPRLQKESVESFDKCAEACRAKEDCIQWMWETDRCHLGKDIRLGDADERETSQWESGWLHDRIDRMKAELESCSTKWTE